MSDNNTEQEEGDNNQINQQMIDYFEQKLNQNNQQMMNQMMNFFEQKKK